MAEAKTCNKQKYELTIVVETFLILEKILEAKGGLGLAQIYQSTAISKNKSFRILATLIQCGILDKDEKNNYKIGITSIQNAHKILSKASILDSARFSMECLSKVINEAVYLAKYTGSEAVLVDFIDCCQPIKATSFVGAVLQIPFVTHGNTVAKIGDIAVDTDGLSAEVTTVSMPYTNEYGVEIGALVVLAPTYRMTPHRIKTEIVPALRDVMLHKQLSLNDSLQEKFLSLLAPSGREYAKYPHLVAGMSTKPEHPLRILT